jgi:hypothetical protein
MLFGCQRCWISRRQDSTTSWLSRQKNGAGGDLEARLGSA